MHCNFCDLDMQFNEYSEHVDACGSRTDHCELCNQVVMLKDMEAHKLSSCNDHVTRATQPQTKQPSGNHGNYSRNNSFYEDEGDDLYNEAPQQILAAVMQSLTMQGHNPPRVMQVRGVYCNNPNCHRAHNRNLSYNHGSRAITAGPANEQSSAISRRETGRADSSLIPPDQMTSDQDYDSSEDGSHTPTEGSIVISSVSLSLNQFIADVVKIIPCSPRATTLSNSVDLLSSNNL